jgi:hypothetical protein
LRGETKEIADANRAALETSLEHLPGSSTKNEP